MKKLPSILASIALTSILLISMVACSGTTTTSSSTTTGATSTTITNTTNTSTTTSAASSTTTTASSTSTEVINGITVTRLNDGRIKVPSEVFAPSTPTTNYKFDRTFNWYQVTPLSGTGVLFGTAGTRGGQFAADDINAQGGIVVDGLRYKVVIKPLDNAYDTTKTAQAVQQIVDQYNSKYVSVTGTGPVLAVEDYLAQRNIFNLGNMGALPAQVGTKWPLQFCGQILNQMGNIQNYYPYFIDKGAKTAVLCTSDNDTGRVFTALTRTICSSYPIEFKTDQYFKPGTQDFSPLINAIMSQNVDVVDGCGAAPGDIALLAKQLREKGYKGFIQEVTVTLDPATIWGVGGPSSTGIVTVGFNGLSESPSALYDSFAARYKAKYNEEPYYQAYFLYELSYYAWQAITLANSFDTYKVADTYAKLQWNGVYNETKWTGDEPGSVFGIRRICNVPTPLISLTTEGKASVVAMPSDGSNGKTYRLTSTIK
jgi:branched-chain amino acid transport system substrate-binding protein